MTDHSMANPYITTSLYHSTAPAERVKYKESALSGALRCAGTVPGTPSELLEVHGIGRRVEQLLQLLVELHEGERHTGHLEEVK